MRHQANDIKEVDVSSEVPKIYTLLIRFRGLFVAICVISHDNFASLIKYIWPKSSQLLAISQTRRRIPVPRCLEARVRLA